MGKWERKVLPSPGKERQLKKIIKALSKWKIKEMYLSRFILDVYFMEMTIHISISGITISLSTQMIIYSYLCLICFPNYGMKIKFGLCLLTVV